MDRTPEHERAWVLSEGALGSWDDALQLYATSLGQAIELTASAARIETLTEALQEIEAHLADHWNCGAVQLFLIASRALVTARAALTPEDR